MMKCAQVRPILSSFLEKETDPLQTLDTRRHLGECGSCNRRADRLRSLMAACDDLPVAEASSSIADSVMSRLRGIRSQALAMGTVDLAAKWTGLMVLLGVGLTAAVAPAAPALRSLARPFHALIGLVAGGDSGEGARNFLSAAGPAVLRLVSGETSSEVAGQAGLDLSISMQVLATGLLFGFMLVIPVAIVTAWMLHTSSRTS